MFRELIAQNDKFVITTHTNPDGDAIGSSLAMYHYLKDKGKMVHVIVPNKYPGFISWLPGDENIIVYEKQPKKAQEMIKGAELIFCLDYNSIHRSGSLKDILEVAEAERIMIDHHPNPNADDFEYMLSKVKTSSTAELVYEFIHQIEDKNVLTMDMACALYVGIMTDTGSFSYACNYPETFMVTAKLLETGIDGELIHRNVYDTFSEDRLRLLGYCLSEKLVVLSEYATAYIALSSADLKRYNYQVGDTEGVVNYALSIAGISMAVLLTERSDRIRLSFRSKGSFRVNEIASTYFMGGGHKNAAGGDSYDSLEKTISKLESILPKYKESLLNISGT